MQKQLDTLEVDKTTRKKEFEEACLEIAQAETVTVLYKIGQVISRILNNGRMPPGKDALN